MEAPNSRLMLFGGFQMANAEAPPERKPVGRSQKKGAYPPYGEYAVKCCTDKAKEPTLDILLRCVRGLSVTYCP